MRQTSISLFILALLWPALGADARATTATPAAPGPVAPLAPAATPGQLDLRDLALLDGPDFYHALGRNDLAARYERRRDLKTGLRVTGGVALTVGVVWGLTDLIVEGFAHAIACPSVGGGSSGAGCQNGSSGNPVPWLVALGGLGMVTAPAFFSTDPLSPAEKRALLYRAPTSLSLSIAPVPGADGAAVRLGGRF